MGAKYPPSHIGKRPLLGFAGQVAREDRGMTNNSDPSTAEKPATDPSASADAAAAHDADRPPTPAEERAAESAAADVDEKAVSENYRHMTETGAAVKGEGQIE